MRILVVNAGSSSLKLSLLGADDATLAEHDLEGTGGKVDLAALESAVREAGEIDAVATGLSTAGPASPARSASMTRSRPTSDR